MIRKGKRRKRKGRIHKFTVLLLAVLFLAFSLNSSLSIAIGSNDDILPVVALENDIASVYLPSENLEIQPDKPITEVVPQPEVPETPELPELPKDNMVTEEGDTSLGNKQEMESESGIDSEREASSEDSVIAEDDTDDGVDKEEEGVEPIEALGAILSQGTVGNAAGAAQWTLYECGTVRVSGGTLRGTGTITGSISPWHAYRNQVLRIEFTEPTVGVSHLTGLFRDLHNLQEITGLEMLDVSNVTAMTYMFRNTNNLVSIGDVSGWNTANVTSMAYMFRNAESLRNLDVSSWNTGSVDNMHGLFHGARSLTQLDVSNWNVSRVTNMASMFSRMDGITNLNLSNWNPVSVVNMSSMFHNSASIVSIGDVSNWNTGNVTNMRSVFHGARALVSVDVGNWNVSNVTTMYSMFGGTRALVSVGNISGWNTGNVTTMFNMFSGNPMTDLDLSAWNVSNVQNMQDMFYNMHNLTTVGDISGWNTGNVTTMRGMFWNASSLDGLDLSNWNVGRVTNMSNMFLGARNITNLGDISNWDTRNVTNMAMMFRDARGLTMLDLSGWNTANVTNMSDMFRDARGLRVLNLRDWNTGNVTNMNQMFFNANALRQITLGRGWQASGCDHRLLDVWTLEPFTGRWQNVGPGTPDNPLGDMAYPSEELLDDFDPDRMADTWVWEVYRPQINIYDIWRTNLQRRDWIVTNPHYFNDNHGNPRPAFPIFVEGEGLFATQLDPVSGEPTATLGEMFDQFFHNEMRKADPNSSGNEAYRGIRFPDDEGARRIAFRVWHGTPNQRFHIDIVADSDELFPDTRWGQPHFQYAYVQYLHFNQNFDGNGAPSDINANWRRMNIMGSYYDRMFVYRNNPAVSGSWEGSDIRYETLGNHLFPTSPNCPPHPYLQGIEPVSRNVVHPQGLIFGGWFNTLTQANNLGSQEGRVSEREMGRVTTDLNRTIYARWYRPLIEKDVTPAVLTAAEVVAGARLTYTITVDTVGMRSDLVDFVVEDNLHEWLTFVPGSVVIEPTQPTPAYSHEDGRLRFYLQPVPAGALVTITFEADVYTGATELIENIATLFGPPDGQGNRNTVVQPPSEDGNPPYMAEVVILPDGPCDCGECEDCYEPYVPCDCGECEDCYEPYIPCDCGECEECYEPYIPCDCGECEDCYEPYAPCNCGECEDCYVPYIPYVCDCGECEECNEPYIPCLCDCCECRCGEQCESCDCAFECTCCESCEPCDCTCKCECNCCDECDACKGNCDCQNNCLAGIGGGGSGSNNRPNTPAGNQNPPSGPQTGDNTNVLNFVIPMLMSFMVLVVVTRKKILDKKR